MSYGAVQSAIAAMKNNRNLLSKRKRGKGLEGGYNHQNVEFNLPEATPEILESIRLKTKSENKKRMVKRLIVLGAFVFVLFTLLSFILYNLKF